MSWLISAALLRECENSRCLQEQEAESSAVTCSDGEPLPLLNVMPTQHPFWRNDRMMDFSGPSLFGLTCGLLTEGHGAAVLTWCLEDSHARTYQSPEAGKDLTESAADCGRNLRGSLAKYDRDSHTLKTAQHSLLEDSTLCCVTLPRSGSMRNGAVYQREKLAHRMSVIGCGYSLPTPTASAMPCEGTVRIMRKNWQEGRFTLEEASAIAGKDVRKAQGKVPEMKYPTPQASDNRNRGTKNTPAIARRIEAEKQVMLSMTLDGPMNPTFPEWLMGWPIGWTESKPLETGKFHEWQRQHSPVYTNVQDGEVKA